MYILKVMKRKDASSIVVAVAIAISLSSFLNSVTMDLTGRVTRQKEYGLFPTGSLRMAYLFPVVSFVLQLVALEVVLRLYVWGYSRFGKK